MRDVVLEGIRGLPEAQTPVQWNLLQQLWFDSSLWVPCPLLILQSYKPKGNCATAGHQIRAQCSQYRWNLDWVRNNRTGILLRKIFESFKYFARMTKPWHLALRLGNDLPRQASGEVSIFSPVTTLVEHEWLVASVSLLYMLVTWVPGEVYCCWCQHFGGALWNGWCLVVWEGHKTFHPRHFLVTGRAEGLSQLPIQPIILILWPPRQWGLGRLVGTQRDRVCLLLSPLKAGELPACPLEKDGSGITVFPLTWEQ